MQETKWQEAERRRMEHAVREVSARLEKEPVRIADFLSFGSRFYRYSLKNNMLIYQSNPQAVYCQSYEGWNKSGHNIKKGERGVRVYVPYQATLLKIGDRLVPLEQAEKTERIRYEAGEIESITKTYHDGVKVVFDIAQTACPIQEQRRFYQMGYPQEAYSKLVKGLSAYLEERGVAPETAMQSGEESILEELAETVSFEVMREDLSINFLEQRFRADAFAVMLEGHLGIPVSEECRERLASEWEAFQKESPQANLFYSLSRVYKMARTKFPEIQDTLEPYLEEPLRGRERNRIPASDGVWKTKEQNRELLEEIKRQVSILEYAREHGFILQRRGRYYTLAQHDSVRIDTEKNCYWRNSVPGTRGIGKGDSVIGFAAEFVHHGNLHEALKELSPKVYISGNRIVPERTGEQRTEIKRPAELILPERGENMRRVYAYLTKSRCISPEVVQYFVDRKMLYQDTKGNCVFVSYGKDEKPVFASFRGTLTEKRFLGDVAGCDYSQGFYINHGADRLIVTESIIDTMSIMTVLEAKGIDIRGFDYLPLGGTGKYEPLYNHLAAGNLPKQILLAEDHDISGVESMEQIRKHLMSSLGMAEEQISFHVPALKDWNEELSDAFKKMRPVSEIPFLEKNELPPIHYCAIQSTEHVQERGFRAHDGKAQYRLVEVTDGQLTPVKLTAQNVMFRTPQEVESRIPEMYKLIPYKDLNERCGVRSQEEVREEVKCEIRKFREADGVCVAELMSENEKSEGTLWRTKDGELYIAAGYAYDDTLKEYVLTEEQKSLLENFLQENHFELDGEYTVMQLKEYEGSQETLQEKNRQFLNRLQQQEMMRNMETEAEIPMGLEM